MKLGEIKIEALKIMFANYNVDIEISQLTDTAVNDENYGSYLVNMPGSINRCFSDLEEKGVLPSKSVLLNKVDAVIDGAFLRFDLSEIISDFFSIERVVYTDSHGKRIGDYDHELEGDVLVLSNIEDDESYRLLYKPKIERIGALTDDNIELSIPNSIASTIPYYIKGDLYRDDEPNEASEARNWYESAMNELHINKANKVNKVKSVYSQTEI